MVLNHAHYALVIRRLEAFQSYLSHDIITKIRISMAYQSVDKRRFMLTISGVKSPVIANSEYTYADEFQAQFDIPDAFPTAIPVIKFQHPIPFHPHVFRSGSICWGTYNVGNATKPSLIVWVVNLLYYLEYNQHPAYRMNLDSPANMTARNLYMQNPASITQNIPRFKMFRVVRWAAAAENVR